MPLQLRHLRSVAELRAQADAWDALWLRSESTLPTARAETVAIWVEHFASRAKFVALVVEDHGRFVAALPLVRDRLAGVLPVGGLPSGVWSPGGDVLVDRTCEREAVLRRLLEGAARLQWPLLRLNSALLGRPYWLSLGDAALRSTWLLDVQERFRVDEVTIDHDWCAYRRHWSRSHRRAMRRSERISQEAGGTKLVRYSDARPSEIDRQLRRAFEVELRGWKGRSRTAVLATPAAFDFFARQARQFAAWGQLELAVLESRGEPIAFEYGFFAKGTYFALKIGYDERFARWTPGQLLRLKLYEQLFDDPTVERIDFLGPSSAATSKWATGTYTLGRMTIAPPRFGSRALFAGYTWLRGLRGNRPAAQSESRDEDREDESAATTVRDDEPLAVS